MNEKQSLTAALDVGERMLRCGAEVNRVEDTVARICSAYGAEQVDVFTITSSIIATIRGKGFEPLTQTRRIPSQSYDLNRLALLNQLSRSICEEKPELPAIAAELQRIDASPQYGLKARLLIYGLISGAFAVFFGGSLQDGIASAVIGLLLGLLENLMRKEAVSRIFVSFVLALCAGFMAFLTVKLGLAHNADLISLGNIMLLIPGIALTNAIRDMFQGDTFAGMARFFEAILLANIVVLGVTLSTLLF